VIISITVGIGVLNLTCLTPSSIFRDTEESTRRPPHIFQSPPKLNPTSFFSILKRSLNQKGGCRLPTSFFYGNFHMKPRKKDVINRKRSSIFFPPSSFFTEPPTSFSQSPSSAKIWRFNLPHFKVYNFNTDLSRIDQVTSGRRNQPKNFNNNNNIWTCITMSQKRSPTGSYQPYNSRYGYEVLTNTMKPTQHCNCYWYIPALLILLFTWPFTLNFNWICYLLFPLYTPGE